MKKIIMMVALASVACSSPDRRSAEVVVENDKLEEATVIAITNWKTVAPEVDWILSNACGDSDRTCVRVRLAATNDAPKAGETIKEEYPGATVAGWTDGHIADWTLARTINITVLPWNFNSKSMPLNLYSLMTHEMGHALGLHHIDEETRSGTPDFDVMYPMGSSSGHDCIGPKSLAEYNDFYGTDHKDQFCW